MRIAVVGAGAIGSALAALLARGGQDVTLVGRPAHVAAIRRDGLRVDGCLGAFTLHLQAAENLTVQPDLVLLTVKTQDATAAVRDNRPYLSGVPLVLLQNGVRSADLVTGLLDRRQLISAVVRLAATYLTPGNVTVIHRGALLLGRPFGPGDEQVHQVARLLNQVIPTRVSSNVRGAQWLKLIVNLNNALPALTNCTLSQVIADPYLSRLGVALMREGLRVVNRAGIRLAPLPSLPAGAIRSLAWLPTSLTTRFLAAMAGRDAGTTWPVLGSTLQSIRRGRPTEIDYLNGEVVRLGEHVQLPTPMNAAVVRLVHHVEQTGRFLPPEVIRKAMTSL